MADGNHDGSRLCERARCGPREQRRGENNAENGINEAEKFRPAAVHAQSPDASSGAQSLDGGPSDGEPAFSPSMQANSNPGVQQAPFARRGVHAAATKHAPQNLPDHLRPNSPP